MSAREDDARTSAFVSSSVPENYERLLAPSVFVPWAEVLLERVAIPPGSEVLDVASGTGVVARLAALRAGPEGRVVATDVSPAMLATAASIPAPVGAAPIERLESAATALQVPDASFDVALCQQGLPFFTDRPAAARELRRVLRAGGTAGVAVWVSGRRLEPFDTYNEALEVAGVEPPFPGAWEPESFKMSRADVEALLAAAGFSAVEAEEVEAAVRWPDAATAASSILGTPMGPLVEQLPDDRRIELMDGLVAAFGDGPVERRSVAVIARATA